MSATNPFETLQLIAGGSCLPRCLHVIADLGVADALDDVPRTASELAATVGANPDSLSRVLRLLSAHGVFQMDGDKVRHSPASELLRTDHPHSMRGFARMFSLPVNWNAYLELEFSVRTGLPAVNKTLPRGFWVYFQENPEAGQIFNDAMVAKAQAQVPAIVAAHDFSPYRMIGDIGGGRGHLIRAVLESNPAARGVLFDLPHVIQDATGVPNDRLTLKAGDFFKDPLPVCDAYILMEVIHDWGDEESLAILQAIRRAARPRATLLLIEQMVPNDAGPHWSKMLDIHMLTLLGGRQRTRQEYEALLGRVEFSTVGEIPTRSDVSILEARAV